MKRVIVPVRAVFSETPDCWRIFRTCIFFSQKRRRLQTKWWFGKPCGILPRLISRLKWNIEKTVLSQCACEEHLWIVLVQARFEWKFVACTGWRNFLFSAEYEWFEFHSRDRLNWLRIPYGCIQSLKQMIGCYLNLGHGRLISRHFKFLPIVHSFNTMQSQLLIASVNKRYINTSAKRQ